MDKLIEQLEAWTSKVLDRLDSIDFEQMASLIEERQMIINRIKQGSISDEYRRHYQTRIRQIVQHDEKIMNRMKELKEEAVGGVRKINTGRVLKSGYDANYALDGIFFDKRK